MNDKNVEETLTKSETLKSVVQDFLEERLQAKVDKLKDDEIEKREKLIDGYRIENWVADAARRVSQIQQVTHGIKFSHPDARGSNQNAPGNPDAGEMMVGTHTVKESCPADVVGNAAALDVYKFLRLEADGKTVLARAVEGDEELQSLFSDDAQSAQSWMSSFAGILEGRGEAASHKLAKQLYWPLDNEEYHLLAPLFPTALTQVIWNRIRNDRFSDETKAAREARRSGLPYPHGYQEYPDLVVQQFGGTKPQNISQLNSERHGENYLLPSCPPQWQSAKVRPPLKVTTVFGRWLERRKPVSELIHILHDFLASVKEVNNVHIRRKRAELIGYICDEVIHFAAELRDLPGGWSSDQNCRLNMSEQFWLDPERAEGDESFAAQRKKAEWQEEICRRFANWLNARLSGADNVLPMGEAEAREWRYVLDEEMKIMRRELNDYV